MENVIIVAVKAVIMFNKKALIIQRAADDEVGANLWEFAGGKLDFGENLEAALKREVKEEVGLAVTVDKLLYASTFKTHEYRQLVILSYLCTADNDNVRLSNEHQNYMWANKEQMMDMLSKSIVDDLNHYSVWTHI